MFEIYAAIAIMLLSTGLIGLACFVVTIQTNNIKDKLILRTLILESTVTILLSVFYICCAVILSQGSVKNLVFNDNDLAIVIVNDTSYTDNDIPTFYNKNEPTHLDQTNEIEDARNNNKEETSPRELLENYQHLVQTVRNVTNLERTFYERMLPQADEATVVFLEHSDCFLRLFFHQALLVHSFLTCAISLLITCHCFATNENPAATQVRNADDNSSERFGEKILDHVSDSSSENGAPVGPLFDKDGVFQVKKSSEAKFFRASSSLDVFTVKETPQQCLSKKPCPERLTEMEEGKMFAMGKCGIMLTLPAVFVVILYFIMQSGYGIAWVAPDMATFDLLPHLNITTSDIAAVNLVKKTVAVVNGTHDQKELDVILRRVYAIVNRLKDEQQEGATTMPTVRGQYFRENTTKNDCFSDKTNLKAFDFLVFVVFFFLVILYAKVSAATRPSKNMSNATLNKCTVAFSVLWTPIILYTIFSMFITDEGPNIVSGLFLLVGNMDRLYSMFQNIGIYKQNGLVKPTSTDSHL